MRIRKCLTETFFNYEYGKNTMFDILKGFVTGLKKSFSGKDYLREISQCDTCGKPSFFANCLKCETDEAYRGWGKKNEK